jgi:glyoxylase-like metal-dependent hydrolase (beta-lactamase superfamily II)
MIYYNGKTLPITQIKIGFDNFGYIIFCPKTKKAAVVDPGYDAYKLIEFLKLNDLKLVFIIATHHHCDHTGEIKIVKSAFPTAKIVASKKVGSTHGYKVEKLVSDKEQIKLGKVKLKFLLTPGHTIDGLCILVDDKAILTGDTLFIGDCGRVDMPGGSLKEMYETLDKIIKPLSDDIIVYPGHDYGTKPFDKIGNLKLSIENLIKNIRENI